MSGRTTHLLPPQAEYLTARGVPLTLAREAGLRSVSGAEASELLGRRQPLPWGGLAIPYPDTEPAYARVRLDAPHEGAKFLAPGGREVPVYLSTPLVMDPATLLCVVEGPVKALSVAAHGYAAIGLGGTGTTLTSKAGVRQLNDSWSPVPLAERPLVIIFDAARDTNPNVARDEARLALSLGRAGARVRVAQLPPGPQGRDQGPDDFLAAHGKDAFAEVLARAVPADPVARAREVVALPPENRAEAVASLVENMPFLVSILEGGVGVLHRVRDLLKGKVSSKDLDKALNQTKRDLRDAAKGSDGAPPLGGVTYAVVDGRMCRIVGGAPDVVAPEPLANFNVKIVEEVVQDDGVEERRRFRLEGELADGTQLPPTLIDPAILTGSDWAMSVWGARAILSPDRDAVAHLRCAMQLLSTPESVRVYQHTGFRKIGDTVAFLHAGGAVGAQGIQTSLDGPLARYRLPLDPEDPRGALELALEFLGVGPRASTLPLLAAAFRAPTSSLFPPDVCLWAVGQTGSTKSTQVALVMALFGEFDRLNLTASWNDTYAAIETRLNRAKDVLAVIDDYAPKSNESGDETRRKAEQVLRALGNGAPRARMRSDLTERPDRPPRGLVVSTGEDRPSGESVTARSLVLKFDRKSTNLDKLKELDAQRRHLRHAMAAYIAWLLARYEGLDVWLRERFDARRSEFTGLGGHLRTPEAMAHMALGVELLGAFATDIGVLGNDRGQRFVDDGIEVLRELSAVQGAEVRQVDPVQRFLDVLRLGVMQGRFLLVDPSAPLGIQPGREAIGWSDEALVYLSPEATYRVVVQDLTRERATMPLGQSSLWERLIARGLLQPGDAGHFTRKCSLGGGRPRVLVMPKWVLEADGTEPPPEGGGSGGGGGSFDSRSGAPPANTTGAASPDCPDCPASEEEAGGKKLGHHPGVAERGMNSPATPNSLPSGTGPAGQQPAPRAGASRGGDGAGAPLPPAPVASTSRSPKTEMFPMRCRLVSTYSGLAAVAAEIDQAREVALAVMPVGDSVAAPNPRLLALKVNGLEPVVVDLHMTWGIGALEDALRRSLVVGHDLVSGLSQLGVRYPIRPENVWDTMLAARVLDFGIHHEQPEVYGLPRTLERSLGVVVPTVDTPCDWSGTLGPLHVERAVHEVEHLLRLRDSQRESSESAGARATIDLENEAVPATLGMALAGIRVDRSQWHALVRAAHVEAESLRSEVERELQIENVESPEQLRTGLLGVGVVVDATNKTALAPHDDLPVVQKIQIFRRLRAFVSGPGEGVLAALDRSKDARVRARFNQLAAPTGRFGCSAPALLAIPKRHAIRACFVPDPGHVFVVADYRTIELRVIAHITQDARLLEVLRARGDLHELTARDVLGVSPERPVTKDERTRAKSVNFGFCYGGSARGFVQFARAAYGVTFSLEEAELFKQRYLSTYSGVRDWHERVRNCPSCEVTTLGGRVRVLLEGCGFNEAVNTPVQGTAADGAKRALALLHQRLPVAGGRIVLFVHDEFVVEVPEQHAEVCAELMSAAMIEGMSHYIPDVPIEVDVSIRTSWSGDDDTQGRATS